MTEIEILVVNAAPGHPTSRASRPSSSMTGDCSRSASNNGTTSLRSSMIAINRALARTLAGDVTFAIALVRLLIRNHASL